MNPTRKVGPWTLEEIASLGEIKGGAVLPDRTSSPLGLPFMGELMRCEICGREQQSTAGRTAGWRALELNDRKRTYFCPAEFPPDTATAQEFKAAYEHAIKVAIANYEASR